MSYFPGSPADDTLLGTTDNDLILGHGGNDLIFGRTGSDVLIGGAGNDSILGDSYFLLTVPYEQWEFPTLGMTPGPGDNLILGGAGNDTVLAGYGANTVFGGAGDDSIMGYGAIPSHDPELVEALPQHLYGGAGNDFIRGGSNNDLLCGGAGADTLQGSTGVDTLVGGAGHDVFVFGFLATYQAVRDTAVGPGERDIIRDFHHGQDVIDLSGYTNWHAPPQGQPAGIFLGTGDFVVSYALQARYDIEDGNTIIKISAPNGYRNVDDPPVKPTEYYEEVELTGIHHLTASDFILPDQYGPF